VPREPSFRLFFALWPPHALRAEILKCVHQLPESSAGRAVPVANFHITLAFLGDVRASRVDQALSAGARTLARPFELCLDRIESWPDAKVLCLAPTEVPPALEGRLRLNLLERQFRLKRQHFRPHVTLARDRPRHRPPASIAPLRWSVDDFVLVRSEPASGGSKYVVLARWPLQGVDTAQ
jgi:2'-5' RNA ligase